MACQFMGPSPALYCAISDFYVIFYLLSYHAAIAPIGRLEKMCTISESDDSKFELASFKTRDDDGAIAWVNYQCYDNTRSNNVRLSRFCIHRADCYMQSSE